MDLSVNPSTSSYTQLITSSDRDAEYSPPSSPSIPSPPSSPRNIHNEQASDHERWARVINVVRAQRTINHELESYEIEPLNGYVDEPDDDNDDEHTRLIDINEEEEEEDDEDEYEEEKETPLPWGKVLCVSLVLFSNTLGRLIIFPFLPFMVHRFYPDLEDTEIGYRAGYLGAAFSLGGFFGSIVWGVLSDRFGRRFFFLFLFYLFFIFFCLISVNGSTQIIIIIIIKKGRSCCLV